MIRIIVIALVQLFMLNSTLSAATWTLTYNDETSDTLSHHITLTDKEHVFHIENMQCWVSGISIRKLFGEYFELRDLECNVSKDTRVSIDLGINVKAADCSDLKRLLIRKKDKLFTLILMVQCK